MVVLLLDPADWHACSNIIAEWLYWKQREGGNLRIVLTKHPRATARAAVVSGLRWDDVLRRPVSGTPRELVFVGDSLVYHAGNLFGNTTTPLLAALRRFPLAEAVEAVQSRAASIPPQPPTQEVEP